MLEIGNVSCQIVMGQNITNIAYDGKFFGELTKSKQKHCNLTEKIQILEFSRKKIYT